MLDGVHNTRIETPIVQLQSSKSAWFIRIKSHGLDLEKVDFKNFLWFVRSIRKGTVYRSADSTEARRAHLYKHTLFLPETMGWGPSLYPSMGVLAGS